MIKLLEKDDFIFRGRNPNEDTISSKSELEEDLTYSEFSITTANSSVISSQLATSKFKTFKSKI